MYIATCVISFSADLYFLVQWLEDEESALYDAIPARDITPPEGGDVLSLQPGMNCRALFGNKTYPARLVAVGKYALYIYSGTSVIWLLALSSIVFTYTPALVLYIIAVAKERS